MKLKLVKALRDPTPERKVLLITGDGRPVKDDLSNFLHLGLEHEVMAIGRSINLYPGRVRHWANVDGPDSSWWAEHLPLTNNGELPIRHTMGECRGYDVDWDDGMATSDPWAGSSALFAVLAGLELGYERIYLAGCPLDGAGHWYFGDEHKGPDWRPEDFLAWYEFGQEDRSAKVKSFSGFTRVVLG
jgi:hypothetical protein